MKNSGLDFDVVSAIKTKCDIVDVINLYEYDSDFNDLKHRLLSTKKESYSANEFYVVYHADTDYYLPECPYGLSMFNLWKTFKELDISTGRVIFLSNHCGIKKEIEILLNIFKSKNHDMPIVFDNFNAAFHFGMPDAYSKEYEDKKINIERIEHHGICMIGKPRVHRNAIFNHLKKNHLLDKIKTSYNSDGWTNEI